jgi:AraC-like DNA-binding protein
MTSAVGSRGHLNAAATPPVLRLPAPPEVADVARWVWIPEWRLPAGVTHRALVLAYPACNLVVEPDGVFVYGPSTRISHRDLSGSGWAVGLLLRPAATPLLTDDVPALVDGRATVEAPKLAAAVAEPMGAGRADRHEAATRLVVDWLRERRDRRWPRGLPADAVLANRLQEAIEADPAPHTLDELAGALAVSVRSLQRAARRHVGLTPGAMLRRRRLQDAVRRVQEGAALAAVAAELGYADQAHLTRDFREMLGFTPTEAADALS